MASQDWIVRFPNSKVFHLPNHQSDHLPILLRTEPKQKSAQKKFRVEQWWSQHPEFKDICQKATMEDADSWDSTCQNLRKEVKSWLVAQKDPNWELRKIEKEMEGLINKPQTQQIGDRIKTLQADHQQCLLAQEAHWLQRLRLNWNLMGDRNMSFFHSTTMIRRRRNKIGAIQRDNGDWVVKESEIRLEVVNHFKGIYTQPNLDQGPVSLPQRVLDQVPKIPQEAAELLDLYPIEEEIRRVINSLGPTKAPGPDGITAALVQQNWNYFGSIVIKEVTSFFQIGMMKEGIAHSNLVLIPKTTAPTKVTEFRPISVCNLLYKVISKIIASKMQPWMDVIISKSQTTFIPSKEISKNIIILREIIHSFRKQTRGEPQFVLKVDLAKAFDSVRWDFLFYLLPHYSFSPKLCGWIQACV